MLEVWVGALLGAQYVVERADDAHGNRIPPIRHAFHYARHRGARGSSADVRRPDGTPVASEGLTGLGRRADLPSSSTGFH